LNHNSKTEIERKNKWILYPKDRARIVWDNVMGIFIILSTILTPYNLAFRGLRFKSNSYNHFMYTIDAFFILDILINFFSTFEDQYQNLHSNFKEISKNYYKTWLLVDFFTVLPFDLIFIYAIPELELSDSYNRILKSIKFM